MPSSVAAELASLDASLALLAAERVADRRLSGVRGGEWSCARFDVPPTGAAKTHLMAALADDVSAALERHTGAPAFLAYGTLLGALRERDLLEWSGDVDLTVSAAQAAQLAAAYPIPLHVPSPGIIIRRRRHLGDLAEPSGRLCTCDIRFGLMPTRDRNEVPDGGDAH